MGIGGFADKTFVAVFGGDEYIYAYLISTYIVEQNYINVNRFLKKVCEFLQICMIAQKHYTIFVEYDDTAADKCVLLLRVRVTCPYNMLSIN